MSYTTFTDLRATGKLVAGGEAEFAGGIKGDVAGTLTGAVIGKTTVSKSANYALADAEKEALVIGCTMSAASKTLTLGLAAGQVAFVINEGGTNAFTVKNVSGDTGTSLAAGKVALVVGSATANASTVLVLN